MNKTILGLGLIAGLLATTTVTAVAIGAGEPHKTDPAVVQQVDPSLTKQLAVFRNSPPSRISSATDAETKAGIAIFNDIHAASSRANISLARTAATDNGPFHIVPGDGEVCQVAAGAMACGDSSELSSNPLGYMLFNLTIDMPRDMVNVSGIAADNVERIIAFQPDGSTIEVAVSKNAYSTAIPVKTSRIDLYTTDLGVLSTTVPE